MNIERERIGRPDVRKAFGFPIRQISRRGYASTIIAAIVAGLFALSITAHAQRPRANFAAAIPSPRSVFGFNPGDDRTIADWKQIY